jgi:FAD:protein FMN transferase
MKKTKLFMDTMVDIQVVSHLSEEETEAKINRAFDAFQQVEQACSRFVSSSELMQACHKVGIPVEISGFLFEPLNFAIEIAKLTGGLYDPTIGKIMEEFGFNRHYITGEIIETVASDSVNYQDILIDAEARTIMIRKPLVIDLGAIAKGFAIDLAAKQLQDFDGFVVNAGGDLFAGGVDPHGDPWKIGIQHPLQKDEIIETIEMSNEAICTSGSYERITLTKPDIHHIVNPKTKRSPNELISCSVIAPFAMMADAFSTVSFLLGLNNGKEIIEELKLKALIVTSELQISRVGGI